jgi:hypothetical protein
MLVLLREMREATSVPLAAQPAAFRTTDQCHSFTRLPAFPDDLETIQISRSDFSSLGESPATRESPTPADAVDAMPPTLARWLVVSRSRAQIDLP